MAQRTTDGAVRDIVETDEDLNLLPFITTATSLVDWLESKDADSQLTVTLLERIECFLSAHFYAHRDQQYSSKSTGAASASFQGQTSMILASTQYGQTAMLLDVTGRLSQLSMDAQQGLRRVARARWMGTASQSPKP